MIILNDNHPTLRQTAAPIEAFTGPLQRFCDELVQCMRDNHGAGLAAPQVGVSERIIIVTDGNGTIYQMVNPRIVEHSTELQVLEEGCLSIPW